MKTLRFALPIVFLSMLAPGGFCSSGDNATKRPVEDVPKASIVGTVPAYLDYTPFEWEDYRAVTRQEYADSLHKAIRIGLDKAQAGSTRVDIVQLTSPADIQLFRVLLTHRQNVTPVKAFGDTRLLFDADNGETQVFVDQGGVVSQGTQLWQLSPRTLLNSSKP